MSASTHGFGPDDQSRIRERLSAHPGWELCFIERTGSTQDEVRARLAGGMAGHVVVIADEQVNGRGRHGRSWTQPRGKDLSFSLSCRTGGRYPALLLPMLCAAALWRSCSPLVTLPLRIKWPNDLVCAQGKLAGILIEGAGEDCWIAGIGLNVLSRVFPPELAGSATSLVLCGGQWLERAQVLATLLLELAELVEAAEGGRGDEVVAVFHEGLGLLGEAVTLEVRGERQQGQLLALDPDGLLLSDGRRFDLGEVTALARSKASGN